MGAQQTKDRTLNSGPGARSSTRHKPRSTKDFCHPITNVFTEHSGEEGREEEEEEEEEEKREEEVREGDEELN
ncbi:hypothetical protein WDU94_001762 [Cyamophila willieti]